MGAYRIAYDGRAYRGFQRQPDERTVEGAILEALGRLDVDPVGYAAASRTDAGVSALAQTIRIDGPAWLSPSALNGELPRDIRAWAVASVDASFHPRHDARERSYRYHLFVGDLDVDRASRVCDRMAGTHDFRNFTTASADTVRHLDRVTLETTGEWGILTVRAHGFLRQQVRRMATVIREVGTGAREIAEIDRLLGPEALDGPQGVAPAPPDPLTLVEVSYPGVVFNIDEAAREHAADAFHAAATVRGGYARVLADLARGLEAGQPTWA